MGSYKEYIAVIIPALDPDERMTALVGELHTSGFRNIILVDDGSALENRIHFKQCKEQYGCKIIRHVVNFGKGIALKSAFNYILESCPDIRGAVTVDCDGQHVLQNIDTCARLTAENPDKLILGCRQFREKNIPWRSRFGNKLTRQVIRLLCGIQVSDTQTGLRGLPTPLIQNYFANTKGERFEYEMNMLIAAKEHMIPIQEFPIETIYLEHNESSHFNPFLDSIRIYKVFLKFMLSSLSSFLIDIFLYWLLGLVLRPWIPDDVEVFNISVLILLRTVISRLLSSLFNFLVNKNQVFKNDSKSPAIIVKYYTLCIIQLLLSALLVNHLLSFIAYSTIRKCIIDTILFAISFQIQREWVFKKVPERK
ncbi:MAG: bifunctional glycosyltransferase family 2/GtrA family protein [Lachnospiraceae bacterium]|nr:bifunctional glycosyltransferase family 2/GtrA family protein [Lachnospiraceae bacterium]